MKARKGSVGTKTYNRYEGIVSHYIKPSLGHVQLRKLTPLHIEGAGWREAVPFGRKAGTLKQRTVHHVFSHATTAIRWTHHRRDAPRSNGSIKTDAPG